MTFRGDTRKRILLYFLLGIGLPSGLLGYLAFRGIQNDRALLERERRAALQAAAAGLDRKVEDRLEAMEGALAVQAGDALGQLVREDPAVEAVFTVDSGGAVRLTAAEGIVFAPEGRRRLGQEGSDDAGPSRLVVAARQRELREGDAEGALVLYRRALEEAADDLARAEALMGIARVQRRLGRDEAAMEVYERLRSGPSVVASRVGVPFGAAASLELGSLLVQVGDTARALRVLVDVHRDVLQGRWLLTPARFELLTSSSLDQLEALAGTGALPGGPDSLRALRAETARRRDGALALVEFGREMERRLTRDGPHVRRAVVEAGGRAFPVVLSPRSSEAGAPGGRGVIVDAAALAADVFPAALGPEASRVSWVLRSRSGEPSRASDASPASGSPRITASVAGLPGWTLELALSEAAFQEGFLASRRALYLWAFVLIAGILLFGLMLTIRTVGRELELARMKSDFVSTVSHELKSPLTAIRQVAEMLQADRVPGHRRRRYHDVLVEESGRLSRLVENVLEFARLEAGHREMALEPVDLPDLVEETVGDARRRVGRDGYTIRTEVEGGLPPVLLDPDAVRQALANLLDNGIKYSGSSRNLEVRAFREEGHAVVAVRDFGIGLAPEEAGRVFDRFYRAGDELTRSVKGTGLGLALVRQIALAHGGTVDVRSAPGQGSTFFLRLPLDGSTLPSGTATNGRRGAG